MSATLTLTRLDVAYGARTLVRGLDLVVAPGSVTALVGANGSGKSRLLRTVVGDLPPAGGSIELAPSDATIGWLPQTSPDPAESLLDYVRRRTHVAAADKALHHAAEALAAGRPAADDDYAVALERWLALGGADLEDRLPVVAGQVGLDVAPDRTLGSLSGGQTARAALISVLLSRFEVLLLDEPTNNLDARGFELVTDCVAGHDGPVLVASHDRDFLDRVATHVVELDLVQQRIGHYAGGWSDYVEARDLERRHAREAFEEYAERRDGLLTQGRQRTEWAAKGRRNIVRSGEADKHIREKHRARADRQDAKGARLRRAAERLDVVDQPRKEWELRYTVDPGAESAEVVWTLDRLTVSRGGFTLGPVDLVVARGDRLSVAGANGTGKTTLLATLLGELPPTSGRVSVGSRVRIGVLDQDRTLLETELSVVEVVRSELGWVDRGEVRTLLAKFGLGAEHVDRPARSLSMGERTRALMALFQARRVNVLVLDEPTNHLDVRAIEQLEAALASYAGTLVVVSHDRRFLSRIGVDRVLELD